MEFRLALLLFSGVVVMECVMVHHSHHFVFVDKSKTWKEAQQYCRKMYTDLATIANMDDVQMMKTSAKGHSGLAWIGLHQSGKPSWKWSLADEGSNSPEETGFTAWKDEPDGGDRQECGMMNKEGDWIHRTCTEDQYTICYDEAIKKFIRLARGSWMDAQSHCREHHTDLASVKNKEDNDGIATLIPSGESAWIGLFRDDWVWSDQNKSSFRYWWSMPDNYGNDNCAVAWLTDGGEGRWWDRTCTEKLPFFCRSDQIKLVSEKLTWKDAFMYCRGRDMYLVNVFTKEIQTMVMKTAKDASTPQVWLGLRFMCPLDIWHWTTRQSVCYTNWAAGGWTGREECGAGREGRAGAVQSGGQQQWVSLPETTRLNFICATEEVL